ncbi:hypothetical protein FEM03_16880 [Phragmitibacter flavus]|uniref:Tetratricopeptide repeat protein n=1 Tax=Phragmitibacter flavus TaxID=2576071 RepID=A0A5R8KBF8_9BACT|nr:hypothetical protein [Phragmitibacter flavus]TLD69631.1 hypothetical protein FEM03_16880 [Phragmitibacter flavus]
MSSSAKSNGPAATLEKIAKVLLEKHQSPGEGVDMAMLDQDLTRLIGVFHQRGLTDEQSVMLAGQLMQLARLDLAGGFSEEGIENALKHLQMARLIHEKILAGANGDVQATQRLAMNLVALADLMESRGMPGDHHEAFALHQAGMELRERLFKLHPDSTEVGREVVFGLNKLADFLFRRRQPDAMDQALVCYQRDLEIAEHLYFRHRKSPGAARDVVFSANKLADFYMSREDEEDQERAMVHYRRCVSVCESTEGEYANSVLAMRDLSVALGKLANALWKRKNKRVSEQEEAFKLCERALELRERCLQLEPKRAQSAADLAQVLQWLARGLMDRGEGGDRERAYELMKRSLDLRERLLSANPNSLDAVRDVAVGLEWLGDLVVERAAGDFVDEALALQERGLEIRQKVLKVDPNSLRAAGEISMSLVKTAKVLRLRNAEGDVARALKYYQVNVDLYERLYATHPEADRVVRDLIRSLETLALCLKERGLEADEKRTSELYQRCAELMAVRLEGEGNGAERLVNMAGVLLDQHQPGAVGQAVGYLETAVAANEKRLGQEEQGGSKAAKVELGASLGRLADALERRVEGDDLAKAVGHRRRAVELLEEVARAEWVVVNSAREWVVALEALAKSIGKGAGDADQTEAFEVQRQALDIALRLAEAEPHSEDMRRTVAVSLYLTHDCALAAGEAEEADRYLNTCRDLLRDSVDRGMVFDESVMELYHRLDGEV